jgi:hypothetical protein
LWEYSITCKESFNKTGTPNTKRGFHYIIIYCCYFRKFENVYIGWGHKYSQDNYSPAAPPAILEEFPSGPEITEAEDPTPEEEAALRAARQEAQEAAEDMEEEGEENSDED